MLPTIYESSPSVISASVDANLSLLGVFAGACELRPASLLPRDFPLAKSYISSFPQHALLTANEQRGEYFLLSPTCCYPVFAHLSGQTLPDGVLFTNKANCFRSEAYYRDGERQLMFLMREYIYFHSDLAAVEAWVHSVSNDVKELIEGMGLSVNLVQATDPFFNPADFKLRFQQERNLKHEFVVDGLAVASVNLHLASFCKACKIVSTSGGLLYSACFGVGFDRLLGKLGKL